MSTTRYHSFCYDGLGSLNYTPAECVGLIFLLVQTLICWQSPLTRQYSRDFSEFPVL